MAAHPGLVGLGAGPQAWEPWGEGLLTDLAGGELGDRTAVWVV